MNLKSVIVSVFSTVTVSGIGAVMYFSPYMRQRFFDAYALSDSERWSNMIEQTRKKNEKRDKKRNEIRNANFFGKTPKYRTQLNSLDESTKSHIPFYSYKRDVEKYGNIFLVDKSDFVFSNSSSEEGDDITWSCEAEKFTVNRGAQNLSSSIAAVDVTSLSSDVDTSLPPEKTNVSCRFFIPAIKNGGTSTGKDGNKCKIYSEDLTFLPLKHINSKDHLPQKILISVDKKEDDSLFRISSFNFDKYKKISLKKNGKDYLSIDLKDLDAKEKCKILTKQDISYFLVQAVAVEESLKISDSEKLFKKESGTSKKNYVCKSNYKSGSNYINALINKTVNTISEHKLKNEDDGCEIFELQNNDKNVTNLSQYVSDLVSSHWAKEKIDEGKFYILKVSTRNLKSPYDRDNCVNGVCDNSLIHIYDGKEDKLHARFKLVSKINAYQNKEKPNVFHADHDYQRKLFIAKVKSNQITDSTNIKDLKCSFLNKIPSFFYKSTVKDDHEKVEDCKIYKFDEDIKNIDNLSFKKAATEVTNLSKDNIKNDSYYIVDFYSDKWVSKYENEIIFSKHFVFNWSNIIFDESDIVLENTTTKQKIDLTLETQFFGDYKKDASEKNPFFLFKEGEKLPPKTKKRA